jgi:hypothetical protein
VASEGTSFGRYTLPEDEYQAFVEYLMKKTAEELIFKILNRTFFDEPDELRPWTYK